MTMTQVLFSVNLYFNITHGLTFDISTTNLFLRRLQTGSYNISFLFLKANGYL